MKLTKRSLTLGGRGETRLLSPYITGDDSVASWLRTRASYPAHLAVLALLTLAAIQPARAGNSDIDNLVVVRAARVFLDGGSPYADKRFLYLPSSVLLGVPEAKLSDSVLIAVAPAVVIVLVLVGWWAALRIFGISLSSRLGVGVAGGLVYFAPFHQEVWLGNWTAISAAALPIALLLASRGRWVTAAVVLGAVISLKPMLVPVVLLFVFARKWRALAVVVGLPLVASALAALTMPHPGLFFTKTLPFLLHGQDAHAKPYDSSLGTVLPRLGVAPSLALAVAAALAVVGLVAAYRCWHGDGSEPLRLVETASMLMLATFLVSRPAFQHYVLVVLPILLASLPLRGSVPRSAWFWIVLLPQNTTVEIPNLHTPHREAYINSLMLAGLGTVVACHTFFRRGAVATQQPEQAGVLGPQERADEAQAARR